MRTGQAKNAQVCAAMKIFLLLAAMIFAGCTTKTVIEEKPVFVNVPVAIHCVDEIPAQPNYVTKQLKPDDDLPTVADSYMVESAQKDIHITQLRSLLAGCIKP